MAAGCIECSMHLPNDVYYYSIDNFGAPLCRNHQNWIRSSNASPHAIDLYLALRKRGVPAELEKFDGYKTIDIAIPECKLLSRCWSPDQQPIKYKTSAKHKASGKITIVLPGFVTVFTSCSA